MWCCVSFLVLAGNSFGVMYVLIVQYICAVVSFFWLWREIVLKMRTHFNKIILLGYFIKIQNRCEYIRSNTCLHCNFLFCIFLLYHTDSQVEVQIRILLKDKYRKSCQKWERRLSHFDFLKIAYPVSLF